jgi:hypothetical protein
MKFSVDIGTWDKGMCEPFTAANRDKAMEKAYKIRDEKYPGQDVVQIRELLPKGKRDVFFDYINGRMDIPKEA